MTITKCIFKLVEKKSLFLSHYKQVGAGNNDLPINISKRSIITYYSVNFFVNKNFYDFYDAQKIVNDFVLSFETKFSPGDKVKIQASVELINYQPTDITELGSERIWMTDVYVCKLFNEFVKGQIKNDLMKRVIISGMSGSS